MGWAMATTEKLLTAEEFEHLPDDGKLYDLIDGELPGGTGGEIVQGHHLAVQPGDEAAVLGGKGQGGIS